MNESATFLVRGVYCTAVRYPVFGPREGRWYVYAGLPGFAARYLHRDGSWHDNLTNCRLGPRTRWPGLFPSRDAALAVLMNNPNPVPR